MRSEDPKDIVDVEFTLDVKCTQDHTLDVTSNEFVLDQNVPDIGPVGHPQMLDNYSSGADEKVRSSCRASALARRTGWPALAWGCMPAG